MNGARPDGNSLLEMYQNSAGETGAAAPTSRAEDPGRRGKSVMVRRPLRNVTLFGSNLPGKQILIGLAMSMGSADVSLPPKVVATAGSGLIGLSFEAPTCR